MNEIILRAGFRAVLVAPLLRGEEVVGLLVVRRRTPGAFPQNTIDLIKTFAAQSAVAIENARLFKNVETSLEDLRTTQDRLVQTQKLASLGQLTAGIAHEIKNPLNFVNNFSGVSAELIDELREALGRMKGDDKTRAEITELTNTLRDNLDKIVQHGKRADAIVKNMLLHSREGSGEHRLVDVNALVEESLNLAYHGARAEKQGFKITMERSFDPAAGQVDVFPQEITRALLNLISNGFYAATKRKEQDNSDGYEPTLTASTKNLGDRVEIRIRDNGTGIPPEVKEKMFNPFFTTKPAGEGTGLGLSITHDIIVKQHSGSIEVDTRPASSPRSELFCHAQRRLSLTSEDGRNPTAVLPGLVRGDEATRTQPYDASSSSSAFASFRSRVFIGATASLRGMPRTAAFAPAKAAQRILAESMARSLWPAGIHVAIVVLDGVVDLPKTREMMPDKSEDFFIKPKDVAESAFWLSSQARSAWSFAIEARPFGETW